MHKIITGFPTGEIRAAALLQRWIESKRRALNAAMVIGGKFENGDLPASEILLVTDVLVGRDEQIEFLFGQPY